MSIYRENRNLEASLIDYFRTALTTDGWNNVNLEKVFARVSEKNLPIILINAGNTTEHVRKEIGSKTWLNYYSVYIRIFANDDGQREDLTNWMTEKLEDDIDYYEYTITNNVANKTLKGKIAILKIIRNERDFVNTEITEKVDRYRQLITFQCLIAEA